MYIVAIAWFYVALMMAVAEATNSTGTLLGAAVAFVLYGLLPIGLVLYIMATPARRKAIKAREQSDLAEQAQQGLMQQPAYATKIIAADAAPVRSDPPNSSGHAPASAQAGSVAPVREKA